MYLTIFAIMCLLGLVLASLGLFKPEHSELSLIGFFLLFLLSFTFITGTGIEYKVGYDTDISVIDVNSTLESTLYTYESYTSLTMGIYLAIGFASAFIGVIMTLGDNRRY